MRAPGPLSLAAEAPTTSELLTPYLPRLVIDWARTRPDERWLEVDGSVAFVDISGFTNLTERLARKGKVGAEEMSDTLDACFTKLLTVAYAEGAGLVKWGGDAVLLLFSGDDNALRACRAAVGMQRRIEDVGKIRTTAGSVTLRMSVGIHTGVFQFFLLGDVHRELVLTGPSVSTTVAMESVAEAGEVAVSGTTAAALDPAFHGEERGGGMLITGAPDLAPAPAPRPNIVGLDLVQYLPLGVREHLLADRREPEHRLITVAFVEFSGTDDLLAEAGVEAVADALDECVTNAQRLARRHQVTFLETDIAVNGGKIMLAGGAPTSAGNDEERVLRTVRALVDASRNLPLRVGVNSGRVFAGDFGPPYRRTFSVKGDAVNLAARLMGKAAPGQILATHDVLVRSRTAFVSEHLPAFAVKGKSLPVEAYAVGSAVAAGGTRKDTVPLVGRERELTRLLEALAAARDWEGRAVEIVAEAGLGKSRLVAELHARMPDVPLLQTSCDEYESSTPYFPFRALLRQALALDAGDRAELGRELRRRVEEVDPRMLPWLPLLAVPLEADVPSTPEVDELDERFRRLRLEEVTRELLGLVHPRPTVFAFEDVHWMDDASSALLARLTEGIEHRPWLLVVTRRDDEAGFTPGPLWARIDLAPLELGEAVAFGEIATDESPLPPHELAALAARSGGNPLFLGELLRAARTAEATEGLPDSVEGLLAAEIDQLAPSDRIVLRSASVLGAQFPSELLESVLDDALASLGDDVWRRLDPFLVRENGEMRFRHALVRDAAYEGLPFRRRRELHGRAGETIERSVERPEDAAERLSFHFFAAARLEQAWRYSRIAADHAKAIYANAEAATFYDRALKAAARLRSVSRVDVAATAEALGDVYVRLGEFARAGKAYRRARQRRGREPAEQARLMLKAALVPWRVGDCTPALRWVRRGLRTLGDGDDERVRVERARLLVWQAVIRLKQGHALEAVDLCRDAIDAAERAGARDALAHAYVTLDWAYVSLGRAEEAVYSSRSLALYEELGDVERQAAVLNNMGAAAYYRGSWDESVELYDRARRAWEKVGDRWSASFPIGNRAEILSDQGRLAEADRVFRDALRVARSSGSRSRVATVVRHLGRLRARQRRYEEARALLSEARETYRRDGLQAEMLVTDARLAECLVLEGSSDAALSAVTDALERVTEAAAARVVVPTLQRVRGWALLQLGRYDAARDALQEALRAARKINLAYEVALVLEALAALARVAGEDDAVLEEERRAILTRLGVVSTPPVPLPGRAKPAAS